MPRSARILLSGYPHHIIQRGHNRQTVFASDDADLYYLTNLAEWKKQLGCKVYAYCLMASHVHLIVDPGADARNLSLLMKRVAGRQTRYVNKQEQRSGTLWEGRYKSSPISTDDYLLACCRYVELNPVRAGIVADPEAYRWSSCRAKVGLADADWLDFDPYYKGLAASVEQRQAKYRDYMRETVSEEELELIRHAIQRGQLTGPDAFVEEIEAKLGQRIEFRGPGRPRKVVAQG